MPNLRQAAQEGDYEEFTWMLCEQYRAVILKLAEPKGRLTNSGRP
jgi:hypothetical protein